MEKAKEEGKGEAKREEEETMTEGSAPQITLAQLVEHMIPSDRLIIKDGAENVLYRGYVATVEHHNIDMTQTVKRFGLATEIFRKEKERSSPATRRNCPRKCLWKVSVIMVFLTWKC